MTNLFSYRNASLHCEDVDCQSVAEQFGTPAYVYSKNTIVERFRSYQQPLAGMPHTICFAVKANSNLAVLQTLASEGAGFDIVSGGELFRALQAGARPQDIVFSGVGKTKEEVVYALQCGIHSFNCESHAELDMISEAAVQLEKIAPIAIRVNPDVDAFTHPYISTGLRDHKFGLAIDDVEQAYEHAMRLPGVKPIGVSCHIGSQLLDIKPVLEAADKVLALVGRLKANGVPIEFLDLGGGLGVAYREGEQSIAAAELVDRVKQKFFEAGLALVLEPGRSIVAEAGILLTRVLFIKENSEKKFIVVDAAMNDLIRPTLYSAYHEIVPVHEDGSQTNMTADIVGPVCETGDFFARSRQLPTVAAGDLLAIRTAGAYGFALSSNYNARPRVCELLIDGMHVHVARKRETYDDLIRGEALLP